MRRKNVIMLFLLFVLFLFSPSFAKVDMYVRNQPFNFQQIVHNGEIYVQIEPFLKALGFGWRKSDGIVELYFQEKGFPNPDLLGYDFSFKWGDNVIQFACLSSFGKNFVPVKDTAKKLGAVYMFNSSTNILDVLYPHPGEASTVFSTEFSSTSPGGTPAGGTAASTEQSGTEPIKAEFKYFQDYNPSNQGAGGDVRGTLTVTNASDKKVDGVSVIVHITDQDDKDLHQQTYIIGTMQAGAVEEKPFYWLNPNPLLAVKHKLEINYAGKNE